MSDFPEFGSTVEFNCALNLRPPALDRKHPGVRSIVANSVAVVVDKLSDSAADEHSSGLDTKV